MNSYYFFKDGEILEEVDAKDLAQALEELNSQGYKLESFDYYIEFNREFQTYTSNKIEY